MADGDKLKQAIAFGKSVAQPTGIPLKDGTVLTPEMFATSAKNGLPFSNMQTMANYYNEWSRKIPATQQIFPYYRHYGSSQNINGGDMAILQAKYAHDPTVMAIINRNIAPKGELPMYSPDDGDTLKALAAKETAVNNLLATTVKK